MNRLKRLGGWLRKEMFGPLAKPEDNTPRPSTALMASDRLRDCLQRVIADRGATGLTMILVRSNADALLLRNLLDPDDAGLCYVDSLFLKPTPEPIAQWLDRPLADGWMRYIIVHQSFAGSGRSISTYLPVRVYATSVISQQMAIQTAARFRTVDGKPLVPESVYLPTAGNESGRLVERRKTVRE